jgi:hypothetical protein
MHYQVCTLFSHSEGRTKLLDREVWFGVNGSKKGKLKDSIKQLTRCTINLIFITLSLRHRSTCFGHCFAHHQEPPPTAFAASGWTCFKLWSGLVGRASSCGRFNDHSLKPVQPGNHTVTRGCKSSWKGLLMMGNTVPETCWAVSTRQRNKYKIDCASGWLFYWIFEEARNHKP